LHWPPSLPLCLSVCGYMGVGGYTCVLLFAVQGKANLAGERWESDQNSRGPLANTNTFYFILAKPSRLPHRCQQQQPVGIGLGRKQAGQSEVSMSLDA